MRRIKMNNYDKYALIDDEDYELIRPYYLGSYNTEEQAALVYNNAALKLHEEFACINIL